MKLRKRPGTPACRSGRARSGACAARSGMEHCPNMRRADRGEARVLCSTRGRSIRFTSPIGDERTSITVKINGGLKGGPVHVWKSDAVNQFAKQDDLAAENGSFSLDLESAAIYTFTTTTGQQKGNHPIPARHLSRSLIRMISKAINRVVRRDSSRTKKAPSRLWTKPDTANASSKSFRCKGSCGDTCKES